MLGCIYYTDLARPDHGMLPPNTAVAVHDVVFGGALGGQFFFGWLGDRLGRKSICGRRCCSRPSAPSCRAHVEELTRQCHGHPRLLPLLDIFSNNRLLPSSAFSLSTIAARGRAVFEGWRSVMASGLT